MCRRYVLFRVSCADNPKWEEDPSTTKSEVSTQHLIYHPLPQRGANDPAKARQCSPTRLPTRKNRNHHY